MFKNKKNNNQKKTCSNCSNAVYSGEGCFMCLELDEPVCVIDEWVPTNNHFKCKGKCYSKL